MAGNIRLNTRGIPVAIPGYEQFQASYAFDATHPVLLIWRDRGKPEAEMPPALKAWLDAQPNVGISTPDAKDIAMPYHYGKPGDVYHFGYAWIYPATD
jgi:hypothetical protein